MKPGSVRPNQRLQEASRCVWGGQEVDPRRIGISAGAKRAVANMGAGLPRDFHTAWAICSKLINVSAAGQNAIDPVVAVDAFGNAVIARRAFDGVIYRA